MVLLVRAYLYIYTGKYFKIVNYFILYKINSKYS